MITSREVDRVRETIVPKCDSVYAQQPYASKSGTRSPRNEGDGIFQQSGGQLLLQLTKTADGFATTFDIGLQI
jgi:hypothetical protein